MPMIVIAHRGASGERPEHTRAAYELAIAQGCDFIEPDLVMSRDGHLIVRHEPDITLTTDIADRPAFADRRRLRVIDGVEHDGWFACDLDLAELQTLRCLERLPDLRRGNVAWADQPILTFQQVIDIARTGGVGVYPELKSPTWHAGVGLPMEDAFVAALAANGLDHADAPAFVQCFEVATLRRLADRIETPRVQLMSRAGGPADLADVTYAAMTTDEGLRTIATYAQAIGVEAALVLPDDPTLIARAHATGLQVHAWTFRAENRFLPPQHQRGDDPAAHGDIAGWLAEFRTLGLDAAFTDFPSLSRRGP